ncbi:MAG: quinolinate synthase [Candidatus Thorarchaeota archaeon]|nr:MAG: quinolinate synthase [Candidatus Thorarchaeota archaeon]
MPELQRRILELKKKRRALIVAHNYQPLEIQQIADFVGDSLQLARKCAADKRHDIIVFAGVRFMAEMAAVLSNMPVYIPAPDTLCPLAGYVTASKIRIKKRKYPGMPVVVYVNTTAEAKSECDVVCTSGNAVEVVQSLGVDTVLFGPDKNLADHVRRATGIRVIDIEPKGHCYVHQQFDVAQIQLLREEHPDAVVIAHPECPLEVQEAADMVGSTGMMAKTVAESPAKEFILATEIGMVEQLQAAHPDKVIIPAYNGARCIQMKKNSLEKILRVLEDLPQENRVTVPDELVPRVRLALRRMSKAPSAALSVPVPRSS